ncbi:Yip1 family protein [Paraferrimonas sedimenticola]|uniref:Yip1 domain-containing protein n=1 Tax=Paraferrimonas sedimenticola TaxID=375674 RepID=A0AA37W057_9GAMM|nr:Yip1 family protein [Paraferrimonas sedimenticola]GLP95935.1 hypothetical protein GCM10007895_12410 [Paraferrimonas sedimenticola]
MNKDDLNPNQPQDEVEQTRVPEPMSQTPDEATQAQVEPSPTPMESADSPWASQATESTRYAESEDGQPDVSEPEDDLRHPFKEIWFYPREAFKALGRHPLPGFNYAIAALAGIGQLLSQSLQGESGIESTAIAILVALIAGPIGGIVGAMIGAWLFRLTGRWLGGKASFARMFDVFCWANTPTLLVLPFSVILVAWLGQSYVEPNAIAESGSLALAFFVMAMGIVSIVAAIWGMVLSIVGLSEVQEFSIWKAIANAVISFALIIAVAIGFGMVFGMFSA